MPVKGFQGTSLLDYPGRIAALVFYSNCNMRCAYCHNGPLVRTPGQYPDISSEDVLDMVRARRNFIDGVVISGGEPTLDPEMPALVDCLKSMGMLIKLDTNGLCPQVLEDMLQAKLLDFVSLDLKTAPTRYLELGANVDATEPLHQSLAILSSFGIESEFRTTCMPGYVEVEDIHILGNMLQQENTWVLQQFVPEHAMDQKAQQVRPHTRTKILELQRIAQEYVGNTVLRGI